MDNLLNVDPGLLIWTVVTFLLLVFVLWKFVWGKILEGLDQRADKIEGDLERAEKARVEAENTLDDYKKQLAQAKEEASAIVKESRQRGEDQRRKIMAEANEAAESLKERAQADIEHARKQALQDIQEYVAEMVVAVSRNIISDNMDEGRQHETIKKAIKEFQEASLEDSSTH